MEKIGEWSFFERGPDADRQMHASIQHIPSPYLSYYVVDSYIMRGLKFRQLLLLQLFQISRPKELEHQFFTDISMHEDDDLIGCLV